MKTLQPFLFLFRDVSSVELLQKYHQGIRSEIETRAAKFTDCIDLGKSMLSRKHRDSAEVRAEIPSLWFQYRHFLRCMERIKQSSYVRQKNKRLL